MLSCKDNQPIPMVDPFDCTPCESSYCVPIEQGDTNTIEVSLDEITENLITNGDFASGTGWTVGAAWSIGSGVAHAVGVGLPGSNLTKTIDSTITAGYYLVQFDLLNVDLGTTTLYVTIGGTQYDLTGTGVLAQTISLYYYLTAPSTNTIAFTIVSGDLEVDNVEVYKLSSVQYEIKDCTTDEVFYTNDDNDGIAYYKTSDLAIYTETGLQFPSANNIAQQGYASVTLNWTEIDLPDGCYCICFKDAGLLGYEFIENGTFGSSANWDIVNTGATGWSITAGVARHSNIAPPGADTISQTLVTPLDADMCYNLELDIIAAGSWDLTIKYDTATETNVAIGAYLGSGNALNSVIALPANKAITVIHFISETYQYDLDNISIQADPECVLCETTNCISLREEWDTFATTRKMCNILVTGTNANKAFGFSAGYSFTGRIFGVIRNASYPDIDNTEYKDFTGLKSLQYNDNEKVSELQIAEVPQGVHDWFRLALRSQTLTFEIAGETKTFIKKAGDYTPNWRKSSPNAPVIVEIQEVQQVASNARNVS